MGFRDEFAAITQTRQPLAAFTHLRIGGPAEFLVTPRTREELGRVVAACAAEKIPIRVLGLGTNIVVRDEGVTGVVLRLTAPDFTRVAVSGKTVKSGGGASRFNAGDRSGEVADHLVRVEVIDGAGRLVVRERGDIRFGEHESDLDDP